VWADPSDPAAVEGSLNGLLSDSFRERHPDVLSRIVEWRLGEDADRETFEAHCAAIEGFDLSDRLYELTTPTLVVHGTEDTVCPKPAAEGLAGGSRAGSFFTRSLARATSSGWRRPPRSTTLSSAGSRSTPQTRSRSE